MRSQNECRSHRLSRRPDHRPRASHRRPLAGLESLEDRTLLSLGGGSAAAGFLGEYFDNPGLRGTPSFTRGDVRIDFDWGGISGPGGSRSGDHAAVDPTGFSVRWTGQVVPQFSETYT